MLFSAATVVYVLSLTTTSTASRQVPGTYGNHDLAKPNDVYGRHTEPQNYKRSFYARDAEVQYYGQYIYGRDTEPDYYGKDLYAREAELAYYDQDLYARDAEPDHYGEELYAREAEPNFYEQDLHTRGADPKALEFERGDKIQSKLRTRTPPIVKAFITFAKGMTADPIRRFLLKAKFTKELESLNSKGGGFIAAVIK